MVRTHGRRPSHRPEATAGCGPSLLANKRDDRGLEGTVAAGVTMKQLLEAGVHFGHQTRRWNPRMRPFIFTERHGIHILDLAQTVRRLDVALQQVRETVSAGQTLLFVGTKKQAQEVIRTQAERCHMPYVTNRWLGGTLTNWSTISRRIEYLRDLEARIVAGEHESLPKRERLRMQKRYARMQRAFGGISQPPGGVARAAPAQGRFGS